VIGVERIGRYEVVEHLASGGMGQVYLARATGLGGFQRQVVVKTLDPRRFGDDSLIAMFLDEARLLGALHHQYIAPVYDVGLDDQGRYYLVMDYVPGETAEACFEAAIAGGGRPPVSLAVTVVAAVASALDYAHALKAPDGTPLDIVHRDVSLSNVMIGHDGDVKLIDFGIAKFAKRTTQTQIGSLKGKLAYLSPEQVLGKVVDRRADIFALGIVLYELTTLVPAFDGESELIVLEKITRGELKLPSQIVAGYPRELERIVMKALAIDPGLRFQHAGAMGRELEAFASKAGIQMGHGSVAEAMRKLFDESSTVLRSSSPARGRRRFARASSEVETSVHDGADSGEHDVTAIESGDLYVVRTPMWARGSVEPDDSEPTPIVPVEDAPTMRIDAMPAPVPPVVPTRPPPPPAAQGEDAPTVRIVGTAPPFRGIASGPKVPAVDGPNATPGPAARRAGTGGGDAMPAPVPRVTPVVAPLVVRLSTPSPVPVATVTSQVMRSPPKAVSYWWLPLAVAATVIIIAFVLALR
jgi:serine/threonine-protein kinase